MLTSVETTPPTARAGRSQTRVSGNQAAVLAAVRGGAQTSREVEAELDGRMTAHLISGHLSNLSKAGKIRQAGSRAYPDSKVASLCYVPADPVEHRAAPPVARVPSDGDTLHEDDEEDDVDDVENDEQPLPVLPRRRGRPPGSVVRRPDTVDPAQLALSKVIAQQREQEALRIMADGAPRVAGEIGRALGLGMSLTNRVTLALVLKGQIVSCAVPQGRKGFSAYRLATAADRALKPPVRTIEVPTFDAVALRQKIESVLASGASYDLAEVVRSCSVKLPYATKDTVLPQLEALIAAGKAVKIPFGSFTRYQTAIHEDGAKSA